MSAKTEVSINSRAARRGLETAPLPKDPTATTKESDYQPWLHATQGGGVGKKKKVKQLTRQQKVRQQQAVEKAGALAGKLEVKVLGSKERARRVKERARGWEELNEGIGAGGVERVGQEEEEEEEMKDGKGLKGEEWEDVDDGDEEGDEVDLERSLQQIADEPVLKEESLRAGGADSGGGGGSVEEVDEVT